MQQDLCRYLLPRSKLGRSFVATTAAAPPAFSSVYRHVLGCERMTVAANIGNGQRLANPFHGKSHHLGVGCSKARPRYHMSLNN
jgi:hypothetical protein